MVKLLPLFLILSFILLFSSPVFSQAGGKISGEVKDSSSRPVIAATAELLRARDSLVVRTFITDAQGKFEFDNLKKGDYLLSLSAIGYNKYFGGRVTVQEGAAEILLPVVTLEQSQGKMLEKVAVVSRKPFIEQKIDRVIVNVDAQISASGTNALELMELLPGVMVSGDGDISLKGKDGVTIYIDDRPTYLSGSQLANYLKTLPSGTLDRVEIMTNPPAKYDAAGNAGIINIRTKKTRQSGFNAGISSNYSQGVYWRNDNTLTFNYRVGKINFFGNGGNDAQNNFRDFDIDRRYLNPDGSTNSRVIENSTMKPTTRTGSIRLGLDFFASPTTTIGVLLNGSRTTGFKTTGSNGFALDGTGKTDSILRTNSTENSLWKNGSANLNLRQLLNKRGEELTVDLDYVSYISRTSQSFVNDNLTPDGSLLNSSGLLSNLPSDIYIYSAKTDYVYMLRSKGRIEAGLKSSYVTTDNKADFFDKTGDILTPDYEETNHFLYRENINSAYMNANREFGKFSIQTGLRLENTISKGHQLGNPVKPDSSFRRNYTNLFPTVYLSYKLDTNAKNQFVFSYGRRIDRPNYQDLNPFLFFVDQFTYFAGNPFLQPEISNNLELSHIFKNNFTTTFSYSIANNVINEVVSQSGDVFIHTRGNIGKRVNMGISLTGTIRPWKWWSITMYTEVVNNHFTGTVDNVNLDVSKPYWLINANNQFNLGNGWNGEILSFYRTKVVNGQFTADPNWRVSTGIQKRILHNNGSVKFSFRDIFKSYKPNGGIIIPLAEQHFTNRFDTQVVVLSFNYRFGKAINTRRHNVGSQSEQDRIKN